MLYTCFQLLTFFFQGKPCKLAIAVEGQVVARGTIMLWEDNWAVSFDVVLEGDSVLPIQFGEEKIQMKDVLGQHVPWPKNLVMLNEKKVKLNPISVLLILEQMFISQNYITYLLLIYESDSLEGELLATRLLYFASQKSTWTVKDLVKYVDTKMEMDRSTVITLSDEVFGKKRDV